MNDIEATELARRIVNGWPTRSAITLDEWTAELRDLDAGTAGTTFVRLRRQHDRPPSIAQFYAAYKTLHTPHNEPRPEDRCPYCDGTGWIEAPDLVIGDNPDTQLTYTQMVHCPDCHPAKVTR